MGTSSKLTIGKRLMSTQTRGDGPFWLCHWLLQSKCFESCDILMWTASITTFLQEMHKILDSLSPINTSGNCGQKSFQQKETLDPTMAHFLQDSTHQLLFHTTEFKQMWSSSYFSRAEMGQRTTLVDNIFHLWLTMRSYMSAIPLFNI